MEEDLKTIIKRCDGCIRRTGPDAKAGQLIVQETSPRFHVVQGDLQVP